MNFKLHCHYIGMLVFRQLSDFWFRAQILRQFTQICSVQKRYRRFFPSIRHFRQCTLAFPAPQNKLFNWFGLCKICFPAIFLVGSLFCKSFIVSVLSLLFLVIKHTHSFATVRKYKGLHFPVHILPTWTLHDGSVQGVAC